MREKIDVQGVKFHCMPAQEAMEKAVGFLESDTVDTIEILTMDVLMAGHSNDEWKRQIDEIKLVLPGEAEILEIAGVDDRGILKETGNAVFLKLFLKYLQKNRKKIFLLAQSEEIVKRAEDIISRYHYGIRLTGHALLDADDGREEAVINTINGTETDCLISILTSPYQESFISRNRALLNVKTWFGCGAMLVKYYNRRSVFGRLRYRITKMIFRRNVLRGTGNENA